MKKLLSLLLALAMIFSLCACSNGSDPDQDHDDDQEETEASEYPLVYEFSLHDLPYELVIEDEETARISGVEEMLDEEGLEDLGISADDAQVSMVVHIRGSYKERRGTFEMTLDNVTFTMEVDGKDAKDVKDALQEYFQEQNEDEAFREFYADLIDGKEVEAPFNSEMYAAICDAEVEDDALVRLTIYESDGKTVNIEYTFHKNGRLEQEVIYSDGEPYYYYEYDRKGNLTDEGYYQDEDEPGNEDLPGSANLPDNEDLSSGEDQPDNEDLSSEDAPSEYDDLAGTYNITLWVSQLEGFAALTQQQIDAFEEMYPGIIINASIEGVTEADAGTKVVADVASAPDIYCFPQDHLLRLVQASALSPLGTDAAAIVRNSNDASSVAAVTAGSAMYAYPMTSDNGYYLYYDRSIISDEDAESLEAIIAACENNGVKFRFALENAWYTASFFFATGCYSNWIIDQDGNFIAVDDTFNSPAGIVAMKGMRKLAQSSCYDSNADIFNDAGAIVTGIWNANAAAAHFGDNLGAAALPSFTVDGKSYHLGSFTDNKLMGVKPQTDVKKQAVLHLLAQFLTNEQCQLDRYNQFQWGPSNINAQASDAVQANISLAALAKQGAYGQPQLQIYGSWWDIAKLLGVEAKNGTDPQQALDDYDAAIQNLFRMSDAQRYSWTVIGSLEGTAWDTDFPMQEQADGTWKTEQALYFEPESEFKIRQGYSWDVNYGANGEIYGAQAIAPNVEGYYYVVFDPNSGLTWLE